MDTAESDTLNPAGSQISTVTGLSVTPVACCCCCLNFSSPACLSKFGNSAQTVVWSSPQPLGVSVSPLLCFKVFGKLPVELTVGSARLGSARTRLLELFLCWLARLFLPAGCLLFAPSAPSAMITKQLCLTLTKENNRLKTAALLHKSPLMWTEQRAGPLQVPAGNDGA